jgi:hypothetical protein
MGKNATIVKNMTEIAVKIREENALVSAGAHLLRPSESYKLSHDPYAYYREYVVIKLPDNKALKEPIQPDHISEFKSIEIRERQGSNPVEYYWVGVLPGEASAGKLNRKLKWRWRF